MPAEDIPILSREQIELLRSAGYVIVPLLPTEDMVNAAAPSCFQPGQGNWETARMDARQCYAVMIEMGCL